MTQWLQMARKEGWCPTKPVLPKLTLISLNEALERFFACKPVWRLDIDGSVTKLKLREDGMVFFYTVNPTKSVHETYECAHLNWLHLNDIFRPHSVFLKPVED